MNRLYDAKFINRHTGETTKIKLESRNIWEVTEFCHKIEIPEYYELLEISEREDKR